MSKRKSKAAPPPTDRRNNLSVVAEKGEADAAAIAKLSLRPTVQAAITATRLLAAQFKDPPNLNELINALSGQVKAAHDGDLARTEAMMVTQAQTLDLLFHKLTRTAVQNMGHYPDAVELYMRLALRAQSQCRAVSETLHEMKNPRPVAFFQQANIANGPQQVNNGTASTQPVARAGENQNPPNELLEADTHGNQLEPRATNPATAGDSHMATVGASNGPAHASGEGSFKP